MLYQFEKIYSRMEKNLAGLEKALLMAFDPFTNDEIMEILRTEMQEAENDKEALSGEASRQQKQTKNHSRKTWSWETSKDAKTMKIIKFTYR